MKIAVLSDIHGNMDAFEQVLADIDDRGVASVLSLGDNIGYGAEPERVVPLLKEFCPLDFTEFRISAEHGLADLVQVDQVDRSAGRLGQFSHESHLFFRPQRTGGRHGEVDIAVPARLAGRQ